MHSDFLTKIQNLNIELTGLKFHKNAAQEKLEAKSYRIADFEGLRLRDIYFKHPFDTSLFESLKIFNYSTGRLLAEIDLSTCIHRVFDGIPHIFIRQNARHVDLYIRGCDNLIFVLAGHFNNAIF